MTNNTRLQQLETRHRTTHQVIPNDFESFNELIGLPQHPSTFERMKLMSCQEEFYHAINNTHYHKHHLNKSRQAGWTELILRILAYRCFNKYAGGKIIIIAGTREKTTKDIFYRFEQLFINIPQYVKEKGSLKMTLFNDTTIYGMPANPEAVKWTTPVPA